MKKKKHLLGTDQGNGLHKNEPFLDSYSKRGGGGGGRKGPKTEGRK